MKITIKCSPKEAAELMNALLNGAETEAKKPYFPPLLTELPDAEKTINTTHEIIASLNKMNEAAKQRKENAPQAEVAERQENQVLSREEAKEIVKCMDTAAKEALKFQYHTP
ncbi:MAG: hypothetical protein K2N38_13620 [Oscillospiraceae bacterium]|nr:hypothetical protein [Oscillospiraceae bacterium]